MRMSLSVDQRWFGYINREWSEILGMSYNMTANTSQILAAKSPADSQTCCTKRTPAFNN